MSERTVVSKTLKSEQLSARETVHRSDEVLRHLIARLPAPQANRPSVSAKTENKAAGRRKVARRGKSVQAP